MSLYYDLRFIHHSIYLYKQHVIYPSFNKNIIANTPSKYNSQYSFKMFQLFLAWYMAVFYSLTKTEAIRISRCCGLFPH